VARAWDPSKHPRDARGRFTRSRTTLLSDGEAARVRGTAEGFSRRLFRTAADQAAYLRTQGPRPPEQAAAIRGYTGGDAEVLNKGLRTSSLGEAQQDQAAQLRAAMAPVGDDLVLTRTVPLNAFGDAPIEALVGKKVRDAGFTTAALGLHPGGRQNNVTMSVSVPKGTPALFVGDDTDTPGDREVILPDGMEFAVVSAAANDRGGYDMHIVALPKIADPVEPPTPPRQLSETQLAQAMEDALTEEDFDRFDELAAEEERRDKARATRRQQAAARREATERAQAERFEALLDAGWEPEEAVAEAFGVSVEEQRRQTAISTLRGAGYAGRSFDALSRNAFRDHIYQRWLEAEDETRGHMLNRRAEARGVDARALFAGPESVARANASEELLAWWDANGRPTLEEFRADLLTGTGAAVRAGRGDFLQ
jgi:hypothetical protein